MKGPETPGLTKATVPEGTKLLSVEVQDEILLLIFSGAYRKPRSGSTGEMMTIVPIVNSLTELDGINKVQFLVEGKKVETLAGMLSSMSPLSEVKTG